MIKSILRILYFIFFYENLFLILCLPLDSGYGFEQHHHPHLNIYQIQIPPICCSVIYSYLEMDLFYGGLTRIIFY